MVGIIAGFIARELYRDWRDSQELFREVERRERAFNVQLETVLILAAAVILRSAADRLRQPQHSTQYKTRHNSTGQRLRTIRADTPTAANAADQTKEGQS